MNTRKCPSCGIELTYNNKYARNSAEKKNTLCKKCSSNLPERRTQRQENYLKTLGSRDMKGKNNPFYGHKHSEENIKKLKERPVRILTEIEKDALRELLKINGNKKSPFEIWKEKLSPEDYIERVNEFKKLQSFNNSGSKNAMYGKPSPIGSGNGWSGWYKGWFFRSIRELSYVIKELEQTNRKWVSAEGKKFSIKYLGHNNQERTYCPDFLVDNTILIEIKPLKLHNSFIVSRKKEAAMKFCEEKNLSYLLVDSEVLSNEEIANLYFSNQIKFTDRYEKKFKEKFIKDN